MPSNSNVNFTLDFYIQPNNQSNINAKIKISTDNANSKKLTSYR